MLYAGLALLGLALLGGGGIYGYREYLRGKPSPIWVPLALRADLSMEDQNKLAETIEQELRKENILRQVAIDADLQKGFSLPDQEATVKELDKRLFVKVGSADTPDGLMPSINVGLNGTGHEKKVLEAGATRMIREVWKLIGMDPETGRPRKPSED
ncbi:hypothetical protein ACFSSA_02725 [Luteolibacter algae]|uniref:Uncharacterized protein n=1 Tax=Luteolibacter algae TaxID=454151 RepID=A0ABW5D3E2_9BACT